MLILDTNDKIQLVTSAAATLDCILTYIDCSTASPPVVDPPDTQKTAITTATTTDICAVAPSSRKRNVKLMMVRNKHATLPTDVTVCLLDNATLYELFKCTLNPGDTLEYVEGVGFFVITAITLLDKKLFVTADVTNATTSFADITGLTCPVEAGKKYAFETHLFHQTNATTTGAQFGINGPSMTNMIISAIQQITSSVTAATYGSSAAVTAVDTAAVVETTGPGAVNMYAIMSGGFEPSAAGTFAIRSKSEVAVAGGLIIKRGSWCRIWECP